MEGFYTGYPFGDVQLLKYELIPAYEYAILYSNHSDYITSIAIENISYFAEASPYEAARNKLIASSYINRRVDYCVKSDGFIKLFINFTMTSIKTNILDNGMGIAFVGFGINIEAFLVFPVT